MTRISRHWWFGACLAIGIAIGASVSRFLAQAQPQPVPATAIPRELTSFRDIVKSAAPAVVSIEGKAKAKAQGQLGFGSGVIVDPKGVILTNNHVVEGSELLEIRLPDGRKFFSKDWKVDRKTDLAIVKIESDRPLPFLELGDSDKMEVGDRVLAIGAPFGLSGSVTHGIISAKSRSLRLNQYEDFLQTDAAINPGNSGGPLVSMDGRVIGINSAIKTKTGGFQGVGLAISSNLAKAVMQQLVSNGSVKRGYLGVQIRDIEGELATRLGVKDWSGVLVTRVFDQSPAAKIGLKVNDIVITIAGKPIRDGAELQKVVSSLPLGQAAEVVFTREGRTLTVKMTIEEQPDEFGTKE
jgi:serine protease Do